MSPKLQPDSKSGDRWVWIVIHLEQKNDYTKLQPDDESGDHPSWIVIH